MIKAILIGLFATIGLNLSSGIVANSDVTKVIHEEKVRVLFPVMSGVESYFNVDSNGNPCGYYKDFLDLIERFSDLSFEYVIPSDTTELINIISAIPDENNPYNIDVYPNLNLNDSSFGFDYQDYLSFTTNADCVVPITLYTQTSNDTISQFDLSTYDNAIFGIDKTKKLSIRNNALYEFLEKNGIIDSSHGKEPDGVKIKEYGTYAEKIEAFKSGEINVVIDAPTGLDVSFYRPLITIGNISSFCGIQQEDTDLYSSFNSALTNIYSEHNELIMDLMDKYFKSSYSGLILNDEEKRYLQEKGTINIGYFGDYAPLIYENNGHLTGLVYDYFEYLSKYLNVQFNFVYCKDQYAYKVFIDEGNIDMGYSRNFNYIDGDTYLNTISYYSSKESFITTKENITKGTMRDKIGVLGFSYNVTGVDRTKYKIYWNAEQMIKDVNNGIINSCIADTTFYNYYHLNRNYNNIVLYGATDTTNLSFVTLKTNKELHNILNKAISYMNDSGKTEELRGIYENVEVNYTFGQFISNNLLTISLVLAGSVLLLAGVIVLIVLLIIKTKKQNKKLKDYNDHDFLTGLFSKSKYEKDLNELIAKNDKFAFYMIDIDNFKVTNDVFGHSVGDQVLIEMAKRFRSVCNVNVKCYRFAGDEFVITYEYPMKEDVLVLANRLLHLCDNLIVLGNGNKVYT